MNESPYNQGYQARLRGCEKHENPYRKDETPGKWGRWIDGWKDGEDGTDVQKCDPRGDKDALKKCG